MKRAVLTSAFVALMVTGLAAQGRSFGGTWTIDAEKTMAEGGAAGGGGGRGGGGMARSGGGGGATNSGTVAATGGVVMARGGGAGGGGARSGGAGATPVGLTVTVDANTFTIVQGQSTTTYRTDGSVSNLDTDVRKASAKASWQGNKLAIETTTETPNGLIVTHATWYVEGEWLVRENTSTGPDGQDVIRKTYYKKSTHN
jgi:hypothetical protein